tara:strand:+ start:3924 stop:4862 length:939 start_codon:yes stop_codon:yes gene_type:complete
MIKKPKFWDLNKPNFLSYLLFPLTIPIRVNNLFLKFRSKKKFKEVKTICLGNIYIGGTGKTPTTIKLYELLKDQFKAVTAKKLYLKHIDEQIILENRSKFFSASKRIDIVNKAIKDKVELILFDDGLQERKIDYDIKFVCFDSESWIGNGCLIPSGPLREKLNSLKKYDAIFLKNINSNIDVILNIIKKYNYEMPIFHTKYEITNLNNFEISHKYLIFSGIGAPQNFKNLLLRENFNIVKELIFPDHHKYSKKDIDKIKSIALEQNAKIITTEKDFVKIPKELNKDLSFAKVDILVKNEKELMNFILKKLNE